MPITPLPTPVPSSGDPANFDARADEFLEALPGFATEANELAAEVNAQAEAVDAAALAVANDAEIVNAAAMSAADAAGLVGRMTGSLAVNAGVKNITLSVAKPNLATLNRQVAIKNLSDASIVMFGTITEVTSSTVFKVTVVSGGVLGAGTYSEWQIIDGAFFSMAATAAELWAQASAVAGITPKTVKDAKVWVALTDAATVTPSGLNGRNFEWTITADRTLGAITNCAPNDVFRIKITQNATGGWDIAWASGVYKRVGGLPTLAQTAGQKTHLKVEIVAVDGAGTATDALVTVAANPTN